MYYTTDNTYLYPNASFDLGFDIDHALMGFSNNSLTGHGDTSLQWPNDPMGGIMMGNCNTLNHSSYPYSNLPFDSSDWIPSNFEQHAAQVPTSQLPQDTWQWGMASSSTSSLYTESSTNFGSSFWPWDLFPSAAAPFRPEDANYSLEEPPATTHDHQDMLSFLSNLQTPTLVLAPKPKRTRNRKRARELQQLQRASAPRVTCPNFHLCGKTFCRKDALTRHLNNTCGMQSNSCVGTLPVGVTCMHHQGSGRRISSERLIGGWARAAPY